MKLGSPRRISKSVIACLVCQATLVVLALAWPAVVPSNSQAQDGLFLGKKCEAAEVGCSYCDGNPSPGGTGCTNGKPQTPYIYGECKVPNPVPMPPPSCAQATQNCGTNKLCSFPFTIVGQCNTYKVCTP
ncbi:MAG: hypothetical protein SFX72_14090 [Isosphaeraceae bacterium]|nr:hypothetical protein [Isosphaeraceae bacterium]